METPMKMTETKRKPEESTGADAKKQKVEVNMPELTKQIHYYFSDENLKHDKFFHTTISADKEGWLSCDKLLACKKVQALKATSADIVAAVKESKDLESKVEGEADDKNFIRRTDNKELPKFEGRARVNAEKDAKNPYDGGVVIRCINVPEWAGWGDAKDSIRRELEPVASAAGATLKIAFCTNKKEGDEGQGLVVDMVINPFPNDIETVTKLQEKELVVSEDLERKAKAAQKRADKEAAAKAKEAGEEPKSAKEQEESDKKEEPKTEEKKDETPPAVAKTGMIKVVLCDAAQCKRVLVSAPKWVSKKREEFARDVRKKKQVKVHLGEQVFVNIQSVKAKVKEVLNARMAGQELKKGSPDYTLMSAVFKHHPRADTKLKGMSGLKVDKHPDHEKFDNPSQANCFFVIREDGTAEDISVKKCLDELQVAATAAANNAAEEKKE